MTNLSDNRQICIWEADGFTFEAKLSLVRGIGTVPSEFKGLLEVETSALNGLVVDNSMLRIHPKSTSVESKGQGALQILVLQSATHEMGVRVDRIIHYGDSDSFDKIESISFERLDETSLSELGLERSSLSTEASNASALGKTPLEKTGTYIFFQGESRRLAMSADDVLKIRYSLEVEPVQLVSERALGFLRSNHMAIPVLNFQNAGLSEQNIIVTHFRKFTFGFPIRSLEGLAHLLTAHCNESDERVIDYGDQEWLLIAPEDIVSPEDLELLYKGYESVFGSPESKEERLGTSSQKGLLQISIGPKVCVPIALILSIDMLDVGFDRKQKFYPFRNASVPFFDASAYYESATEQSGKIPQKIIFLEKDGVQIAVAVDSVDCILMIDRNTEIEYGSWLLNDKSSQFKNDVRTVVNAFDYQHQFKMNVMTLSFDSLFQLANDVA